MHKTDLRVTVYQGDRTEPTSLNILAFEARWVANRHPRAGVYRRNAIISEFRMKPTRFQQLSLRAIDDPEAASAYPDVVAAIRKRQEEDLALRESRTFRRAG